VHFLKINSLKFMMQAIKFFMSSNLTVQGLKVKNSPQFHFRFDACQYVEIELLNIDAPAQSPNTDGIHIENTNNVKIYNSVISNGNYMDIKFSCLLHVLLQKLIMLFGY
jgi:hypothetical protein